MAQESTEITEEVSQALIRVADALDKQTDAINALIGVLISQDIDEESDGAGYYLDGTPIEG